MRILHYIPSLHAAVGGPARAVIDLCAALALRGHAVTIATADAGQAPQSWQCSSTASPHIVLLPRAPLPAFTYTGSGCRELRILVESHDIVHVHGIWEYANVQICKIAAGNGKPYIVSVHGMLDPWSMRQGSFKKQLYLQLVGSRWLRNASRIHLTTQAEFLAARRYFPEQLGRVVPLLMDLQDYRELPGPALAEARLPARNGRPRVLFLSRLHPKKNLETLLLAAQLLEQRGRSIAVVVAGDGDPAYVTQLQTLASSLNCQATFLGMVTGNEKLSLYQACDIFALPTQQENFGLVFIEAMGCGLPVITTHDIGSKPELAPSGAIAFVERTPAAFADVLEASLFGSHGNFERGQRGREWVFKSFDPASSIERFESCYANAIATHLAHAVPAPGSAARGKVGMEVSKVAIFNPIFAHYRTALVRELRRSAGAEFHFYADTHDGDSAIPAFDFNGSSDFFHSPVRRIFNRLAWQSKAVATAWFSAYECLIFLGDPAWLSTWIAAALARLRGRRVLFWTHGWLRHDHGIKRSLRLAFYRLAHGLLLYGERAAQIGEQLGYDPARLHVMYNSLDFDMQQALIARITPASTAELRMRLFADSTIPVVIATARLTAVKRFDLLIDALDIVNREFRAVHLLVVGDGPERGRLAESASSHRLKVAFVGACYDETELAKYFLAANVTVSPGNVGLTCVHSLGYGVPVITHDDAADQMPEWEAIEIGVTGALFNKGSTRDLALKIEQWTRGSLPQPATRERCRESIARKYHAWRQAQIIEAAALAVNQLAGSSTRAATRTSGCAGRLEFPASIQDDHQSRTAPRCGPPDSSATVDRS